MAHADCFDYAGSKYQIAPQLLRAIAEQESGFNHKAINHNKNAKGKILSTDYGIMQINSNHIPELKSLGVIESKQDLLDKPCLNVQIGAWILAKHLKQCGVNWMCLGTYNAGFKKGDKRDTLRMEYAKKIYSKYLKSGSGV